MNNPLVDPPLKRFRFDDHDYTVAESVMLDEDDESSSCSFSSTSSGFMNPSESSTLLLAGQQSTTSQQQKKRRQRLTHLTAEEKLQRRKLKNRVAAQSARDRKKARMEELEESLAKLQKDNEKLMKENKMLKNTARKLLEQNRKLLEAKKTTTSSVMSVGATSKSALTMNEVDGSAASAPSASLPWTQLRSASSSTSRLSSRSSSLLQVFLTALLVLSTQQPRPQQPQSNRRRSEFLLAMLIANKLRQRLGLPNSTRITLRTSSKRHGRRTHLAITNFPT